MIKENKINLDSNNMDYYPNIKLHTMEGFDIYEIKKIFLGNVI